MNLTEEELRLTFGLTPEEWEEAKERGREFLRSQ